MIKIQFETLSHLNALEIIYNRKKQHMCSAFIPILFIYLCVL